MRYHRAERPTVPLNVTRFLPWLHKWIGIVMGVMVFVWLASGMVMILPVTPIVPKVSVEQLDMRSAVLSPAAALDLVATREGSTALPRRVLMVAVDGAPYYRVDMKDGNSFLINASSDHGELFGEHGLKGHANAFYLPLI